MSRISYIFLMVMLMAGSVAIAQKAKKPSLTKVEALVNKGKEAPLSVEELKLAKSVIEDATEYEKTMDKTRTWYLRGYVYKFIYETENDIDGISKPEAVKKSAESFNKALELGKETDTYVLFANQEVEQLWSSLLNGGVEAYQGGNLEEAVKFFEYTSLVKPTDTTGYLYAASASSENKEYNKAVKNYKKLVEIAPSEERYGIIISLQKDYLKDLDAAQATVAEAKSVLGEDNLVLNQIEIDIFIALKKVDEALGKIEKAIEADPENSKLYLRKGLLYDQLALNEMDQDEVDKEKVNGYVDEAGKAYKKTIELDDKNLTAYFNYAVIISNKARVYINEANMMNPQEFRKRGKALEQKGIDTLKEAIPLMEKARELSPDDRDVLVALESFYTSLKMNDKAQEVGKRIEELGYN